MHQITPAYWKRKGKGPGRGLESSSCRKTQGLKMLLTATYSCLKRNMKLEFHRTRPICILLEKRLSRNLIDWYKQRQMSMCSRLVPSRHIFKNMQRNLGRGLGRAKALGKEGKKVTTFRTTFAFSFRPSLDATLAC